MDYHGCDPLLTGSQAIRKCIDCDGLYDGNYFDKCTYCFAKGYGLKPSELFSIAEFCDKARVCNGEILPG